MYIDPFALRITCLGAGGGFLLAIAIFLIEESGGSLWRKALAAACLLVGVLALILAVTS